MSSVAAVANVAAVASVVPSSSSVSWFPGGGEGSSRIPWTGTGGNLYVTGRVESSRIPWTGTGGNLYSILQEGKRSQGFPGGQMTNIFNTH